MKQYKTIVMPESAWNFPGVFDKEINQNVQLGWTLDTVQTTVGSIDMGMRKGSRPYIVLTAILSQEVEEKTTDTIAQEATEGSIVKDPLCNVARGDIPTKRAMVDPEDPLSVERRRAATEAVFGDEDIFEKWEGKK